MSKSDAIKFSIAMAVILGGLFGYAVYQSYNPNHPWKDASCVHSENEQYDFYDCQEADYYTQKEQ